MAANTFPTQAARDVVVFEYVDTLSFEIPDGQRHLKVGQPVAINKDTALVGVLVTNIRPENWQPTSPAELTGYAGFGHNGPNHATVRLKGVVKLAVTSKTGAKVGDPVYFTPATGNTGEPGLSLTKGSATIQIGVLKQKPSTTSGKVEMQVLLDPKTVA